MKWRQLEKELKSQGFSVEPLTGTNTSGVVIISPSGQKKRMHQSTINRDEMDPNIIVEFKDMGYEEAEHKRGESKEYQCKYCPITKPTATQRDDHEVTIHRNQFLTVEDMAKDRGDVSASTVRNWVKAGRLTARKTKSSRGKDMYLVAKEEWDEKKHDLVLRRTGSPVRVRQVAPASAAVRAQRAMDGIADSVRRLGEFYEELKETIEPLVAENKQLQGKLKRIADSIGKAVDNL